MIAMAHACDRARWVFLRQTPRAFRLSSVQAGATAVGPVGLSCLVVGRPDVAAEVVKGGATEAALCVAVRGMGRGGAGCARKVL